MRSRWILLVVLIGVGLIDVAHAFPPYRSTDAGTADPWTLEPRLGLVRLSRERSDTDYLSPLLRVNLGLPSDVEVVSEFQYDADEQRVDDAAVGLKWVPIGGNVRGGIETIALLPNSNGSDPGIESLLLVTWASKRLRIHLNAGGFYDPRPADDEKGWKAGAITELHGDGFRPGFEVFAKRVEAGDLEIQAGPGLIVDLGGFDLRLGFNAGLTRAADDFSSSVWLTTAIPLQSHARR